MTSTPIPLRPRHAVGVLLVAVLALVASSLGLANADTPDGVLADGTCVAIDFAYDDGATDVGVYCGFGNELNQTTVPSLTATTLHISCSDEFPGGVGEKSDLGGRLVTSWSIQKYKDGELDKECAGTPVLTDPEAPLPGGIDPDDDCYVYSFTYDNGTTDAGTHCGDKDLTRDDAPDLNAVELHLSCSDKFENGYGEKSDIGSLRVTDWSIQKYKDGELDKECTGTPVLTDPETPETPETPDGIPTDGDCVVIDFR